MFPNYFNELINKNKNFVIILPTNIIKWKQLIFKICNLKLLSLWNIMDMNLNKLQEMVKDREAWHAADHGVTNRWTWLSDWTTKNNKSLENIILRIYNIVKLPFEPMYNHLCAYSLCCVWLCATLWTTVCQAPLSMGFSRQEHWSGLPCPPPGDLPNPGIKPRPSEPPG